MRKLKELSQPELYDLYRVIIDEIVDELKEVRARGGHLDDIGNHIGLAVGKHTCDGNKDRNLWAFEKDDFISGFEHGYSLRNGKH